MSLDRELMVAALPAYTIEGEIGRGGWGVVLSATHNGLGRRVAIKQLPRAFGADPAVRTRFKDEARLVASLTHPHIVPVFDFVEYDGLCLIVMELLTGGTLWDRFLDTGVPLDDACALMLAACTALQHAHNHGILHRDIKPENFLFADAGTMKLGDFGIAKVIGSAAASVTVAGSVMGTPAYMAPEQALGQKLGPGTDIYSIGVMLYELACGDLPFPETDEPLHQLIAKTDNEPRQLVDMRPDIHPAIAEVTMKAIARHPEDRYASARELGMALATAATQAFGPGWLRQSGIEVMSAAEMIALTEQSTGTGVPSMRPGRVTRASGVHPRIGSVFQPPAERVEPAPVAPPVEPSPEPAADPAPAAEPYAEPVAQAPPPAEPYRQPVPAAEPYASAPVADTPSGEVPAGWSPPVPQVSPVPSVSLPPAVAFPPTEPAAPAEPPPTPEPPAVDPAALTVPAADLIRQLDASGALNPVSPPPGSTWPDPGSTTVEPATPAPPAALTDPESTEFSTAATFVVPLPAFTPEELAAARAPINPAYAPPPPTAPTAPGPPAPAPVPAHAPGPVPAEPTAYAAPGYPPVAPPPGPATAPGPYLPPIGQLGHSPTIGPSFGNMPTPIGNPSMRPSLGPNANVPAGGPRPGAGSAGPTSVHANPHATGGRRWGLIIGLVLFLAIVIAGAAYALTRSTSTGAPPAATTTVPATTASTADVTTTVAGETTTSETAVRPLSNPTISNVEVKSSKLVDIWWKDDYDPKGRHVLLAYPGSGTRTIQNETTGSPQSIGFTTENPAFCFEVVGVTEGQDLRHSDPVCVNGADPAKVVKHDDATVKTNLTTTTTAPA